VLDLINHEAGFYYPTTGIDCLDEEVQKANLPAAENSQDLIDRMARLPLINQPGATHHYGTGTTVLGLVAERASGKSLKELVNERVTGPMGIEGLQYGLPADASLPPRFSGRDGTLRVANAGELDIFGSALPDYDPGHELYLGGEGMVATADGYADFIRMLLRGGELNGHRFLEPGTVAEIAAPHTLLDNPYGHNGYNLWISNGTFHDGSTGPAPLWIGGGYEGTHFWIDPERQFVGVIMSQIFWAPESGRGRDERIRAAVYEQLKADPALPAASE
jgi:CubicO group peptidase (beta-lactamase class C family)